MNDVDFDVKITRPLMDKFNFPKNVYHTRSENEQFGRGCPLEVGKVRSFDLYVRMMKFYDEHGDVMDLDGDELIQQLILVNKPIATIYCTEVGEIPEGLKLDMDWIKVEFTVFNK